MAISKKGLDIIARADRLHRELELGYHKSFVVSVSDGEDQWGWFICLVLRQSDTGLATEPYIEGEMSNRFKDIVRIHAGQNTVNKDGVPSQMGSGLKRFVDSIVGQKPELAKLDWVDIINAIEGKSLDVWYTRSSKGYINVCFDEMQYHYACEHGYVGGEIDVAVDGKVLNEEAPF